MKLSITQHCYFIVYGGRLVRLLALALALYGLTAHADTTVNLDPQTCTYSAPGWGSCTGSATFSLAFKANNATLIFGGLAYTSNEFALTGTDMAFYDVDGNAISVSTVITAHSKAVNVGRAHYFRHWFSLDSGSVTLP